MLTMATLTMAIRPEAILTMAILPMAHLAVEAWVDVVHARVGPHLGRGGVETEVRGRAGPRGKGRGEVRTPPPHASPGLYCSTNTCFRAQTKHTMSGAHIEVRICLSGQNHQFRPRGAQVRRAELSATATD